MYNGIIIIIGLTLNIIITRNKSIKQLIFLNCKFSLNKLNYLYMYILHTVIIHVLFKLDIQIGIIMTHIFYVSQAKAYIYTHRLITRIFT